MTEKRIFIEQSVLVAASIACVIKDIDLTIKDEFHDISKRLFDFIKNNVEMEIGITTDFVMERTEERLSEIVKRKLNEAATEKKYDKVKLFTSFSYVLIECIREMKNNTKCLLRVPIQEKDVSKNMLKVFSFYRRLEEKLKLKNPAYILTKRVKQATSGGHSVCPKPEFWEGIIREESDEDFRAWDRLNHKFLERDKGPDDIDKRILAECIYLKDRYSKRGAISIFLTSSDQHFVKLRNIKSELSVFVPNEINRSFGILCKWPDELLKEYFSEQKRKK